MATMSFAESVKAVVNGKGSKASKIETLVKVWGLPAREADRAYDFYHESVPATRTRIAYTFGVEIECNLVRANFTDSARENGVRFQYEGYNHNDRRDNVYKFVTDSSVTGDNAIECVSPVLKSSNGFKSLEATCKALNEAGAVVNKSCGLHVHIGAGDLTDEAYVNVFKNYKMLEGAIDSFMSKSRRAGGSGERWCKSLWGFNLDSCTTKSDVRYRIGTRYTKVNSESYSRHKTIEFRQHAGTTDYKKIEAWVKFLGKLVEWSKSHVLTERVNEIDAIPFITKGEKDWFKARKVAVERF